MSEERFRILGIPGSLRRASYNRGMLRAAQDVAPDGFEIEILDLADIPLYNFDVEKQGDPEPVRALKEAIGAADALLIATPEYNNSIPGVLKNAIDWASRPPADSVLRQKPIALMGTSPGRFGTARTQPALRQVFVFTDSLVMVQPELMVPERESCLTTTARCGTRRHGNAFAVSSTVWWSGRPGSTGHVSQARRSEDDDIRST